MAENTTRPNMAELTAALDEAEKAYVEAKRLASQASNAEVDARNRLNTLQRQFDAACKEIRKRAITGTDWAVERAGVDRGGVRA